ncbi:MAG: phosphatase PAP2 family protein [Chloroflexota bacterium]|nr:MAG: phosphatase PAP2 family protein [Chloroflexota bacterium]
MDILGDFSVEVTRWLQENYPQLETPLFYATEAGRFEFYLIVLTLTYWCLHKRLGRAMGYLLTISYFLNAIFKHLVRNQRPLWEDPALALVEELSFGVPSGHVQSATVFYGLVAMFIGRAWAWIVAGILITLMAVSRVYLGVHDIEDVVIGFLLGVTVLIGYGLWNRHFAARFNNRILGQRLLIAVSVPIVLAAIYVVLLLLLEAPQWPPHLEAFAEAAERQSWEDAATAFGLLLGLSIGFVMEISRVRFMVEGAIWRRAVRYVIGLVVALVLWRGLGALLPEDPPALGLPLRIIRYFVVALWVSYYAPWFFVRFNLANARPEPEVTLTP